MGLMSAFGNVFDPDGAAAVASAGLGVNHNLASDRYNNAGNLGISTPGSAANNALTNAIQTGKTPVTAHTGQMTQDAGQLGALSNLYYGLFTNGGPAEAAGVQRAMGDIAGSSEQTLRQQSRQTSGALSALANAERGGNAAGSTETGKDDLLTRLQALVYQAAASHATNQNALDAQSIKNGMLNQQVSLNQQLRDHSVSGQNQSFDIGLQNQRVTNELGNTVMQAGLGLGTQAAGTLSSQFSLPSQPFTTDASGHTGGITAAMPAPTGYTSPYSTPVRRMATPQTSTPYSPTNTVYPASVNSFAQWISGAAGLTR